MHVSFYFFFLCKRAILWYNDVNRNISFQKKSTILPQKSYQFFFSLFLSLLLLRFFLLVCSKEDKELDGCKLKSFAKIFYCSAKNQPPQQRRAWNLFVFVILEEIVCSFLSLVFDVFWNVPIYHSFDKIICLKIVFFLLKESLFLFPTLILF